MKRLTFLLLFLFFALLSAVGLLARIAHWPLGRELFYLGIVSEILLVCLFILSALKRGGKPDEG